MVDLRPGLIGTDVRFFVGDDQGDFAELPAAADLSPSDRVLLYGDGTGRPLGLFVNNLAPGDRAALPHPGHMTRQRRRAAARAAAAKRNRP